jgi:hypothetical protein
MITDEVVMPAPKLYTMQELVTRREVLFNNYNMTTDYDLQESCLLEIQAIDKRIAVLRKGEANG